jgi:hypothetical protein
LRIDLAIAATDTRISEDFMLIGYIYASNEIVKDGKKIGYMFREEPDNENDSGWRVFSGEETQEYADCPSNFALYNASTIVELDPNIAQYLGHEYPVELERNETTGAMVTIEEDKD